MGGAARQGINQVNAGGWHLRRFWPIFCGRMKPFEGYHLIKPEDLHWRPSNLMSIPNADFLERTGSQLLGARLWRLPPLSANTLHKHVRAEEFYFVVEGTGRMRIGDQTLTIPTQGGALVGPGVLRQIFNDTDRECLWLIVGAPEAELEPHEFGDKRLFYPVDPTQLPPELHGATWPPGPDCGARRRCHPLNDKPISARRRVSPHSALNISPRGLG